VSIGVALPNTCVVGQLYIVIPIGAVFVYGCTAPNVWTAELLTTKQN
jgi:hypothetical protein